MIKGGLKASSVLTTGISTVGGDFRKLLNTTSAANPAAKTDSHEEGHKLTQGYRHVLRRDIAREYLRKHKRHPSQAACDNAKSGVSQ